MTGLQTRIDRKRAQSQIGIDYSEIIHIINLHLTKTNKYLVVRNLQQYEFLDLGNNFI